LLCPGWSWPARWLILDFSMGLGCLVCLTPWRKRVHEGSDVQFHDALGPSLCVSEECDGSSSSASRQSRSPRRSRRGESVTKSALTSVPSIFRPDLNSTKSDTDTHRDTHAWVQTCGSNWGELDLDDDQLLQDHEHVDYDCVPYGPPASRSSRHLHALATRTHTHTQTHRHTNTTPHPSINPATYDAVPRLNFSTTAVDRCAP
jgi:hypothetical protein